MSAAETFRSKHPNIPVRILNSRKPEALVYKIRSGQAPLLEAAMYLLRPTDRFADIPPLFRSPLTQFHVHMNLCFVQRNTTDGVPQYTVAGLTDGNGDCRPGQIKFPPVPMIHAWIVANPCGPFSALEGVGAVDGPLPAALHSRR